MRITRRGRRRLLVLLAVVAVMVGGFFAYKSLRAMSRERAAEQAREQGLALYEQGEYEKAMPLLSKAVGRDKDDLEALLAFGDCRTRISTPNRKHLAEGINIYRQALQVDPDNLEALEHLLELYHRVGYRVEGVETADRILEIKPNHVDAWAAKLASALFNSEFEQAVEFASRLSEIEPGNISWRAFQVQALQSQGVELDEILDRCDEWIASWEGDGRFHMFKAQVAIDGGNRDLARDALAQAVERGADSAPVLNSMLMTLDLLNMHEQSEALIAACRTKFPDEPWVFEAAVRRAWQVSAINEGIDLLDEAEQSLASLSVDLLRWKALLHAARSDEQAVEQAVERMLAQAEQQDVETRDAARGWAKAIRAGMQMDEANWLEAIEAYEQALSLVPRDPVLKYLMARAYQQIGEYSMALDLLGEAQQVDRTWVALDLARIRSLLELGRYREALQTAGSLVQQTETPDLRMHVLLARAWLGIESLGQRLTMITENGNRRYDVVAMLETLHDETDWHPEITPLLARAYLQDDRNDDARDLFERALQENPDADVLTGLANVSRLHTLGYGEQLLDQAIQAVGLRENVVLTKARLLFADGRADEANQLLQQAIEQNSDEQTVKRLRWWNARFNLDAGRGGAAEQVIRVTEQVDDPGMLMSLLNQPSVWDHAAVIRVVLDRLKQQVGNRSPQVLLAEARYTEQFEGDSDEAIANAISQVRDVLNVNPNSRDALVMMADLLIEHVDPNSEEAARKLQTAIDAYPTDRSLYPKLVALLQRRGEFNTAASYIDRFVSVAGHTPAGRRAAATMFQAQGNFDDAARVLGQTSLDAMSEPDMLRLASLRQRMNQPEQAQAIYERLLQLEQPSLDAIAAAAGFFASRGDVQDGLSLLKERLPAEPKFERSLQIGRYCLDAGLLDAAEQHLQAAADTNDQSVHVWRAIADLRMAQGRYEAAKQAVQRGLEIEPNDSALQAVLVVVSRELGEDADALLRQQAESLKTNNPALYEVLQLYEHVQNPDSTALDSARQLVTKYPQSLPAWRVAIQMHANAGDREQAIRLARQATSRMPTEPLPAELGARLLTEAGRLDEAVDMARLWRRLSASNPQPADEFMAALLVDLGRPSEALTHLQPYAETLWRERDKHPGTIQLWLHAALHAGNQDQALSRIETLLEQAPQTWTQPVLRLAESVSDPALFEALMSRLAPGLTDDAGRLKRAIAWNGFASRTGDTQALQKAEEIASSVTGDADLVAAADAVRAGIAVRRNQLDQAEQLYRQVLSHNSDALLAMNNLAYVLVLKGDKCDEAVDLARRATERSNSNPDVLDTLAQALACDGQLEKAAEHAQRLVEQHDNNPNFHVTLAEVLLARQQFDEAAMHLDRAESLVRQFDVKDAMLLKRMERARSNLEQVTSAS